MKTSEKAYLLLADGTVFEGKSFGVKGSTIGEVVFATGMTGYQETLTDASYYGQIVTQTFPLIGNYGANHEDFESKKSWVKGYIVREYCETPSNFRSEGDIDSFLKKQGIIGLYGIDTRRLTRIIRESGVMNGMITTEDVAQNRDALLEQIRSYNIEDAVQTVSVREEEYHKAENGRYEVALLDYGFKRNILRCLLDRGCNVRVLPALTAPERIRALNPDGIMLSNGPGDPADNKTIIENLRELTGYGIPTFGICLGHQLLALANGAKTEKLKYGHRGANQPVIDLRKDRTYVTSQNHGYAVVSDSIDEAVGAVSHKNANDATCEGVRYHNAPAFTVQFHPEACGGPKDTSYLFDEFLKLMDGGDAACR
ncbi:carbamoyl phosphate synthase small subunit [Candidatus Soleaferrea massiliensis]|uniref:carbamoyl phosphate synthase small subunit n=1 Tax=Candidatus Soleaferrea massiliensis TaxID=1470354 RepID=UPI00059130DC|nr:carbamoyl phosphate synthase small subunit [Candidatus Soleaferrea massiliensis]